jgi:hypothetical protein
LPTIIGGDGYQGCVRLIPTHQLVLVCIDVAKKVIDQILGSFWEMALEDLLKHLGANTYIRPTLVKAGFNLLELSRRQLFDVISDGVAPGSC